MLPLSTREHASPVWSHNPFTFPGGLSLHHGWDRLGVYSHIFVICLWETGGMKKQTPRGLTHTFSESELFSARPPFPSCLKEARCQPHQANGPKSAPWEMTPVLPWVPWSPGMLFSLKSRQPQTRREQRAPELGRGSEEH